MFAAVYHGTYPNASRIQVKIGSPLSCSQQYTTGHIRTPAESRPPSCSKNNFNIIPPLRPGFLGDRFPSRSPTKTPISPMRVTRSIVRLSSVPTSFETAKLYSLKSNIVELLSSLKVGICRLHPVTSHQFSFLQLLQSWQKASSTHKNGTQVNSAGNLDTNPIYAKDNLSELWLRKNSFTCEAIT